MFTSSHPAWGEYIWGWYMSFYQNTPGLVNIIFKCMRVWGYWALRDEKLDTLLTFSNHIRSKFTQHKRIRTFGFSSLYYVFIIWYMYREGKVVHHSRDIEMNNRVWKKSMMYKCENINIMYNVMSTRKWI